jgi:hypothetical protein
MVVVMMLRFTAIFSWVVRVQELVGWTTVAF